MSKLARWHQTMMSSIIIVLFITLTYSFFLYFADRAFQYIYLNINQLDALAFIMSLFHASTCFENTL